MPIKICGWIKNDKGDWMRDSRDAGRLNLFKWENSLFKRIKTKTPHQCFCCEKRIQKGCYAYGRPAWNGRLCISCFEGFMDNFIQSLEEHKISARNALENFRTNKGNIIKHNVINSI